MLGCSRILRLYWSMISTAKSTPSLTCLLKLLSMLLEKVTALYLLGSVRERRLSAYFLLGIATTTSSCCLVGLSLLVRSHGLVCHFSASECTVYETQVGARSISRRAHIVIGVHTQAAFNFLWQLGDTVLRIVFLSIHATIVFV